jgi:hypothetical protein
MSQAEAFVSKWIFATLNGSVEAGAARAAGTIDPDISPAVSNAARSLEAAPTWWRRDRLRRLSGLELCESEIRDFAVCVPIHSRRGIAKQRDPSLSCVMARLSIMAWHFSKT